MKNFNHIVTIGDSWSWGSELPEDQRVSVRFDTLLAKKFNVNSFNIARESASNFCYKWHWIDWINANAEITNSLVVVGITGPNRHLIYNNSADFFQESPDRLVSEKMVQDNWGNGTRTGGFIRAFPNYIDFPTPTNQKCQENFYRYNYDDKMAEIYTIWEIRLLDALIKESGNHPVFWSNFHPYQQITLSWAKQVLRNCSLVNNLQPFDFGPGCFERWDSHPTMLGHQRIMSGLEEFILG